MLNYLKNKKISPEKRKEWIGICMLFLYCLTSGYVGFSLGQSPADAAANKANDARLSRIESAIHSTACSQAVVEAAKIPQLPAASGREEP